MTNQDELNQLFLILDAMKRDKEYYEKRIRNLVVDKDLPTESRWNLFTAFCKLFKTAHQASRINFTNNISPIFYKYYDSDYRYITINVEDILFTLKDRLYGEKLETEFKEDIMQQFVYSFEYDY